MSRIPSPPPSIDSQKICILDTSWKYPAAASDWSADQIKKAGIVKIIPAASDSPLDDIVLEHGNLAKQQP